MENKFHVYSDHKDSGIDMLGTLLFDCKIECKVYYREGRKDSESHHATSSFLHAFSRNPGVYNDGFPLTACGNDGVLDDGE